jgi:sec-independent protein translocase protein TatA
MGIKTNMGSFSIWHWLLVLAIIILIFGTKKLKNMGTDMGEAVKNFKNAISENKEDSDETTSRPEDTHTKQK